MEYLIQVSRRLEIVSERFLDNDTSALGTTGLRELVYGGSK